MPSPILTSSTTPRPAASAAQEALAALQDEFVDYNEMRIGMSDELAELLPKRYPLAGERCQRLRAALNTVFQREHRLSLASLAESPKRESRAYLDSLEGITPFVASRVTLLGLGAHAFPVDQRLVAVLAEGGACVGLAALLNGRCAALGDNIAVVLSGANVDLDRFLDIVGNEGRS